MDHVIKMTGLKQSDLFLKEEYKGMYSKNTKRTLSPSLPPPPLSLSLSLTINSYTADEIHFNLLAVVTDRKKLYQKEIAQLDARKELAAQKVFRSQLTVSIIISSRYRLC